MKRKLLIVLVLFFCITNIDQLSAQGINPIACYSSKKKESKIHLEGDLVSEIRSLHPIITMQKSDKLEIIFLDNNLGDISITISDNKNNILFDKIKDPNSRNLIIILSNMETGEYIITFMNNQGKYLQGRFMIQ